MSRPPLRVLVIDDSAFARQTLTRMLDASPLVEVVGSARDGHEALSRVFELEPDVITLDLEMPKMDGFDFLRILMARRPTPVLVVSGQLGEDEVWRALELGAADFVAKPQANAHPRLQTIEAALLRKVHAMRDLRADKLQACAQTALLPVEPVANELDDDSDRPTRVIVIGSSIGGPSALLRILGAFPDTPRCAVLVAQHMPASFTGGFAARLDRMTPFRVREARGAERIEAGEVWIAPGDAHLLVERAGAEGGLRTRIEAPARGEDPVPSADRLFSSAAAACGESLVAVVLTGMGSDGREGARQVQAAAGRVIAESEETAVVYGMPRQVALAGLADRVLPLDAIPRALGEALGGRPSVSPTLRRHA